MEPRSFASQTLANGLGTLMAAAVIYLVGVLAGAITADVLAVVASVLTTVVAFATFLFISAAGELARARRRAERSDG